ncbi:MAG: hypothetical protein ABSF03_20985, partial [Streptosporangiaceae bacterium]
MALREAENVEELLTVPGPSALAVAALVALGLAAAPIFPLFTLTARRAGAAAPGGPAIGDAADPAGADPTPGARLADTSPLDTSPLGTGPLGTGPLGTGPADTCLTDASLRQTTRTVSLQVAASAAGNAALPAGMGLAIGTFHAGVLAPALLILSAAMCGLHRAAVRDRTGLRPGGPGRRTRTRRRPRGAAAGRGP